MKKKIVILTIAVLLLSPIMFAEGEDAPRGMGPMMAMHNGEGGPGMGMHDGEQGPGNMNFEERIKEALDLSDKQFKALEQLRIDLSKEASKIKIKIARKELDIKELMLEDEIDFKAIKKVLKEINDLDYQLKLNRLAHLEKAAKILTKEQFAKFKGRFFGHGNENRKEMMKKKMQKTRKTKKTRKN